MSPITIIKNASVTVEYLPDSKIICHTVHKPVDDEEFKTALDAGTEALQEYGACKWLSDDRANGPLSPTFLDWSFKDWQPRTIAAGWKYWANVVPSEAMAAGTLGPVIQALSEMGLRMMLFSTPEEAMRWLDKMEG